MNMIDTILARVSTHCAALLAGDHSTLQAAPFAGVTPHVSPNGSTVLAVKLTDEARAALPASHHHLDLFLLNPNVQLGRHYHRHATAHIHMITGRARLEVDGVFEDAGPGGRALFPAPKVHDVRAYEDMVLFASFQDNPIIQPDGTLDYFATAE